MVSELVPEGGVPNLVKGALASGDEDDAVQPESVPVPPGHDGRERGQRSHQLLLVGVRLDPLELREAREQCALRRVAGGSLDRAHRRREGAQGPAEEATAMTAYATPVAACAAPAESKRATLRLPWATNPETLQCPLLRSQARSLRAMVADPGWRSKNSPTLLAPR